jgi:hypothetical protein
LVLTPAFTALALLIDDADVQGFEAMSLRTPVAEQTPHSDAACERLQLTQASIERL